MNIHFIRQNINPSIWESTVDSLDLHDNVRALVPRYRDEALKRTYLEPAGSSLDLVNHITSDEFKKQIISIMSENTQFVVLNWGKDFVDRMADATTISASICVEDAYTVNVKHLDYRFDVASGMMFFDKHDDPLRSTYFSSSFDGNNVYRSSSKVGKGWLLPNSHNSWHNGGNNTDRLRYFLIYNLKLNLRW